MPGKFHILQQMLIFLQPPEGNASLPSAWKGKVGNGALDEECLGRMLGMAGNPLMFSRISGFGDGNEPPRIPLEPPAHPGNALPPLPCLCHSFSLPGTPWKFFREQIFPGKASWEFGSFSRPFL